MTTPKRRTRSKGEGSISQRADGRWLGQVTLGRDASGKKLRRSVVGRTKAEVVEKLQELREQKRKGALPAASKLTVSQFLDTWLDEKATQVARRTHATYSDLVRLHVRPTALAGVRLQALSPLHVLEWLRGLERTGASPSTRADARKVLSCACESAVDLGLLAANPCKRVKPPRVTVQKRPWLTPDEVQRLLAAASTEPASVRAFATLLTTSGMRFGEVAGLAWNAIDLDAGTVAVTRALKEIGGETFVEAPKSKAARRTIAVPPVAVEALRALHRSGTTPLPSALVFHAGNGRPLRRSNVLRRIWHPLLKKAKVEACGFHAARRSHVTQLVAAGADLRAIAARVGHSKTTLTLEVYAQVGGEADRQLSDLTAALLAKGASA